jgi:hypothetical protein
MYFISVQQRRRRRTPVYKCKAGKERDDRVKVYIEKERKKMFLSESIAG